MKLAFWKMHGAGNDFILLDDRRSDFPASAGLVRRLCARRTGVGSEGLILLRPSNSADFQMLFFNPDGSAGEMCGNGARCAARLAHELGLAPDRMTIETGAGLVRAEMAGDRVRLQLTPPSAWRLQQTLEVPGLKTVYHFVNSGVPHAVIETGALESVKLQEWGAAIRHHPAFAPRGTNVDFMTVTGPDALRVRTYERGVEAETGACGTGSVACALIAGRLGKVRPPVKVTCASGDVLEVGYRLTSAGAAEVTLLGPAVRVFEGKIEVPE
jgi:diaminopimelate epimerase